MHVLHARDCLQLTAKQRAKTLLSAFKSGFGEIEGRLHGLGLADAASNSLEVIVSRLRKKLGAGLISTHRGLGYRLEH